jgi:hypothetical protein
MHDNAIELRKSLFPCRIAMPGNCRPSPSVLHAARRFPKPSRASLGQVPSPWGACLFHFQPRSNNRHRSRFASRQAAVLTLRQSRRPPERYRLLTMPNRPAARLRAAAPGSRRFDHGEPLLDACDSHSKVVASRQGDGVKIDPRSWDSTASSIRHCPS